MAEQLDAEPGDELPKGLITARSKFSIVWLIPLVAVIVAGWLAYQAWRNTGPTITIIFKTADGLEADKTKIKFKNVEIGKVVSIHLKDDLETVRVTAELTRDAKRFLTDKTQFWVVKARIGVSGVSGLETLFSGAYIGIDPSTKGKRTRYFTALDTPPVVTSDTEGKHFVLHSDDLGSIERDDPVFYRKFNVGEVIDYSLNKDGKSVTINLFIRAPFDQWVNKHTRFWNASGIDFTLGTEGFKVDTESLVSILIGGIEFGSRRTHENIPPAAENSVYRLYPNQKAAFKKVYTRGATYVLNFSESVRGLAVGAPVEFRGIQLGKVTDIHLSFDPENKTIKIPVSILIEDSRLAFHGKPWLEADEEQERRSTVDFFVAEGLRAQLKSGNLLTGQLYVDFDFFEDTKPFVIDWDAKPPELPTMLSTLDELTQDAGEILQKFNKTMTQLESLSRKINHRLEPEISATLKQTQKSLAAIENTLKEDSPLQQDMQNALKELARASRSIKTLADYLERHPESLLRGKSGNDSEN